MKREYCRLLDKDLKGTLTERDYDCLMARTLLMSRLEDN